MFYLWEKVKMEKSNSLNFYKEVGDKASKLKWKCFTSIEGDVYDQRVGNFQ